MEDEIKDKGGRPSFFSTPEELQDRIDDYFTESKEDLSSPTISGIAYFLGFESRQSFYDYEDRDGFSYTIKRARLRIEIEYEKMLTSLKNATGSIFWLKNAGWSDKQEIEHSGELPITGINYIIPDADNKH